MLEEIHTWIVVGRNKKRQLKMIINDRMSYGEAVRATERAHPGYTSVKPMKYTEYKESV